MSSAILDNLPTYEDAFGSEFFSPADLHEVPAMKAKIVGMNYDELFCRGVGKNKKIVLTIAGQKKKVAVNKTSGRALGFALGKELKSWIGREITITAGEVNGKAAVLLKAQRVQTTTQNSTQCAPQEQIQQMPPMMKGSQLPPPRAAQRAPMAQKTVAAVMDAIEGEFVESNPFEFESSLHDATAQARQNPPPEIQDDLSDAPPQMQDENAITMTITKVNVKEGVGKKTGKPWKCYSIQLPDKRWASTFSDTDGSQLQALAANKGEAIVNIKVEEKGIAITSVIPY